MTTIKHYFKRVFTQPINILIFVLLPVGIVIVNNAIMVINPEIEAEVLNIAGMQTTFISSIIMVMFAFFGSAVAYDLLYDDLRSPHRWRLLAAPVSVSKYVFANIVVCMVFSLITSALIFVASVIIFNAYIPNLLVFGLIIFLFTLFAQLLGMIMFLLIPKKGTAEAIMQGIVWSTSILGGNMFGMIDLGRVGNFIFQRATPNILALNALTVNIFGDFGSVIFDRGSLASNIAFLGVYVVVAAIVLVIVARRRSF